jgi:hypothetical protein
MKNKRLAIIFVVVTLGGSPQVWQQLNNLIAAVQHRAQIKFLSMILTPQTGADEVNTTAPLAQSEHFASCQGSPFGQTQSDSRATTDSSSRKVKTQRRAAVRSEEAVTLALKDAAKVDKGESLPRLDNLAWTTQNRLIMHGVTNVPSEIATAKSNIVEVVVLPKTDTFAPAFIDSASLPKLRKILEDNKVMRLKTRYLITRPVLSLPSSKIDVVGTERAG